MYEKRRTIPLDVSIWMEKDVRVRKVTASSGLMPNDTRPNVFLSRQFYSDMLNLSSERHRKIGRFDYNRKTFLKKQRHKAETTMPGLLPYIEPFKDDLEDDSRLNGNDQSIFSSFQSFTTRSIMKSESTFSQKKQPIKNKQQISLERINRLSQPKGHRINSTTSTDHIRSNIIQPLTTQDIFGNINDTPFQKSLLPIEPKTTTNDKRFRQLVHLFSEVHGREPSNIQSVKHIIQSNSSLQMNNKQWETKNKPTSPMIEQENNQQILNDSCYSKTDMYLMDTYT